MSPIRYPPTRLEAALVVIGTLQAKLAAREQHIAGLHAQLQQLRLALQPRFGGVAAGREN